MIRITTWVWSGIRFFYVRILASFVRIIGIVISFVIRQFTGWRWVAHFHSYFFRRIDPLFYCYVLIKNCCLGVYWPPPWNIKDMPYKKSGMLIWGEIRVLGISEKQARWILEMSIYSFLSYFCPASYMYITSIYFCGQVQRGDNPFTKTRIS